MHGSSYLDNTRLGYYSLFQLAVAFTSLAAVTTLACLSIFYGGSAFTTATAASDQKPGLKMARNKSARSTKILRLFLA